MKTIKTQIVEKPVSECISARSAFRSNSFGFSARLTRIPHSLSLAAIALLLLQPLGLAQVVITGHVIPSPAVNPTWNVGGVLYVGVYDIGTMTVDTGGTVSNTRGVIATFVDSNGTATVSGGNWTNSNELIVGHRGTGSLSVSGTGTVSNTMGFIGNNAGSTGTATVTGGNWTNSDQLTVGNRGTGSLSVSNGTVSNTRGVIGNVLGSNGTVTVSGGNWTNSDFLLVGVFGTGSLSVSGGTVSATAVRVGERVGSTGTLNIGTGGTAGTLSTASVNGGDGTAVVNFNHTGNLTFSPILEGSLTVNKLGAGTTTLSSPNTYTGGTIISGGTLVYQNTYASGSHSIASGAVLELNAAGSRDYATTTFSGDGTLRKTGAGQIGWGFTAATFNLGAAGLIDVQEGTFIGGSSANEDWTNNQASLNVAAGALFNGVEANVRVGALSGEGTIRSGFNGAGYSTFTFGVGNASGTFSGTLSHNNGVALGNYTKVGTGTQIFTGTINQLAGGAGTGLTISAGTVEIGGAGTFDTGTWSNSITNNGTFHFNSTATNTMTGVISGSGNLIKGNSGSLILSRNNTYIGGTTISGGTLQIGNGGNTGMIAGDITNNADLVFNRTGDYSYSGAVSGTGNFTLNTGILRLSQAQTYTGTTSIKTGSFLVLSNATQGLASATSVEVESGASFDISNTLLTISGLTGSGTVYSFGGTAGNLTLDIASGTSTFDGSFGGPFSGFSITKAGAGTQIFTGNSSHTGTTTVSGGSLLVNGNLGNSFVTVQNSALLGGSGTLGGNVTVQSGGILSPGNSTGILAIGGDLNLNAGSITRMEINGTTPGTGHDQIVVGGTATLGGNLEVFFGGGLSSGDSFTLIDTTNPIFGDFANVINVLGNALSFSTAVTGDHVLTITALQSDFVPFALTPNQTQIAQTIDELALSGDLNGLIDFLNTLPGTSLPAAFDQLAPTQFAFLANSAFANSRFQLGDLSSQMSSRRGGSSGLAVRRINVSTAGQSEFLRPAADETWSVFASATGRFSEIDGDINGAGYDSDSGGLLLGADLKTSDSFILGLYAGYDRTELDFGQNGGDIDSDSAKYGLYGTWFNESGSWVEGVLGGGYHDYESTRRVLGANATGDTKASEFLLSLMTGHDFRFGQREQWLLTPSVGLSYNRLKTNAFTEQGSLAPLTLSDQTAESLQGQISLRLANRSEWAGYKWLSYVDCGWRQEFFDRSQSIDARFAAGGGLFTVNGPSVSRGTATFGAGVNALLSDSLSVGLGYSGEFNSDIQVNQVNASVRISF